MTRGSRATSAGVPSHSMRPAAITSTRPQSRDDQVHVVLDDEEGDAAPVELGDARR